MTTAEAMLNELLDLGAQGGLEEADYDFVDEIAEDGAMTAEQYKALCDMYVLYFGDDHE